MDDFSFQERITHEAESRRIACRILGVDEETSTDELKRAWRRACKQNHPDRNPGDHDAHRRFLAINCAYRFLAYGEPCESIIEDAPEPPPTSGNGKYRLDNSWGLFLWWRDRFF